MGILYHVILETWTIMSSIGVAGPPMTNRCTHSLHQLEKLAWSHPFSSPHLRCLCGCFAFPPAYYNSELTTSTVSSISSEDGKDIFNQRVHWSKEKISAMALIIALYFQTMQFDYRDFVKQQLRNQHVMCKLQSLDKILHAFSFTYFISKANFLRSYNTSTVKL